MNKFLDKVKQSENCVFLPSSGLPKILEEHRIPNDVLDFYSQCGGLKFFIDSDYTIEIVTPNKVELSNPVILPKNWKNDIAEDDISNSWYIIAQAGTEQRISIDFNSSRLGLCYDSFWDIHASLVKVP